MTIKYIPMTDEELDYRIEERIVKATEALNTLDDVTIPPSLFSALESAIEDFDWGELILAEDYALYEDYVDDHRMDGEVW